MKLARFSISDLRNIHKVSVEPDSGINLFIGPNAQGKTSVLEGIHLLATLESFRESDAHHLIGYGKPRASVEGQVQFENDAGLWSAHLAVSLENREEGKTKKLCFRDSKAQKKVSDYRRSRFHTIVFNPGDHVLVRGEPRLRRTFLNRVVGAEELEYFEVLKRYQKALEQRNRILRQVAAREISVSQTPFEEFTDQLVTYGAQVIYLRARWLNRLAETVNNSLSQIAPDQEKLNVQYLVSAPIQNNTKASNNNRLYGETFSGHPLEASLELIETRLRNLTNQMRDREMGAGVTLLGPHREDWMFVARDVPLSHRGSQGEIRSALLALKISEMDLYEKRSGVKPVLLLDDFSSELDLRRRRLLLERIQASGLQSFVTTTEEVSFYTPGDGVARFEVMGGKVQ